MTDSEFVFTQDVRERKSIAASAFRKRNGMRAKGCKLPYEEIPYYKRKELNGPVKTYDLSAPMDFETFKGMRNDLKEKYVSDLKTLYGASNDMIADMLGVSTVTFRKHTQDLAIQRSAKIATWQQRESWKSFCNGVWGGGSKKAPNDNDESVENDVSEVDNVSASADEPASANENAEIESARTAVPVAPATSQKIRDMHLSFAGISSWDELYEQLKSLPIGKMAEISIAVKF